MNSFRALAASLAVLALAGCHVDEHKDGQKDNVAISTPFGSMNVKTNDSGDAANTGIAVYPGATPMKDSDQSHDSADVSMSFGGFHLGVKTAGFRSGDSSDKIVTFYRKDLARYSDVIECRGSTPVGTPVRTSMGLSCDDKDSGKHTHTSSISSDKDELQLRAGSPTKQHIVGITPMDGGTKIELVMLNLPGDTGGNNAE